MFALYLDIQKHHDIEDLAEDEVKGRWRSFMNKWNRGELAEGWYDPITLQKAVTAHEPTALDEDATQKHEPPPASGVDDEEDDDFGPALPQDGRGSLARIEPPNSRSGPTIPSLQDLQSRNEDARSAAEISREQRFEDMRNERKVERKIQKERLEEVPPRAEAGTRERQLEKKRDAAASNRAFAATKEGGGDVEVQESDLMGEDTLSELKKMKKEHERRKTEREVKRDEIMRARAAEREERTQKMKEKEDKTMAMLKELARSRFGDGNERSATLAEND
ncbi:hypothetical protein OHC33_003858 [Knufia fluminis]|uniref:Uncharacterized protein n=1 Tax=Knufia fluminis TaxID=191047 RepID=A0AAN8EN87_9EURO|nr:hypothetical protein OHC33_003858 [Knufia fluminis]